MQRMLVVSLVLLTTTLLASALPAADKVEMIGRWIYLTMENKMDDTEQYAALVPATTSGSKFVFKCDGPSENSVYMLFIADEYLGEGRSAYRTFRYRIDKKRAVEERWQYRDSTAYRRSPMEALSVAKKFQACVTSSCRGFNLR